jgi:PQQ-dependent dehydrogenase (methanol/ethanol family)
MRGRVFLPISALLFGLVLCPVTAPVVTAPVFAQLPATAPATQASARPDDGQWVMAPKNYANTRYSALDQINTTNAKELKEAWTFWTGTERGHEAAPLVIDDTMYLVTPFPNHLYAIDLKNPKGPPKWKYEPKPRPAAKGVACCDYVNRGAAYWEGRVIINTLDGHTIAVNAKTGEELWKTRLADINLGETITMAPLVVKGKVLVGNSGGEFGVRGWLVALDVYTGNVAWRAYSTGPDSECLIGANFKPYYAMDQGKDLGVHTWPPDHWQIGGGTVWGWISYDAELDLIYYGTGNPGSWNPELRPGDNKWACGIFARRPDTGEAIWYYQTSPHDLWDHDGVNECILLDLPIDGQDKAPRKVLVHPGRTGYMYVIDRQTGQVLSAEGFVRNTAAKGVDLQSGRLIPNEEKHPYLGKVVRDITPVAPGAKDWQPSAYSFSTGLLYVPHQHLSMDWESLEANYIAGTPYLGANVKMYADPAEPDGNRGEYMAWDIINKKKVWGIKEKFPVWSGTLATAGDVCFYGTMDGYFKAVHAKTGEVLWQHRCESGIIGQPVTYKGPDGKQYVAILSGVGGWAGAIVAGALDPRDPTAALGFVGAMKDLPEHTKKGGMLHVFSLP